MKTVVLQTFRTNDVPEWLARCLKSVRDWSAAQGYDYDFRGDEIFDLCGDAYLEAVGDNKRSITNLARLEWIRTSLSEGYERAIWLDADTFIFDPERFSLDVRTGYACGKEVWVELDYGQLILTHKVHNAALVFAEPHRDLDVMIDLIRYIAATRPIEESFQVGVKLLTGLHAGFRFPLVPNVGMFSGDIIRAIALGQPNLLRLIAKENGYPVRAANLGWSLREDLGGEMIRRAMDTLEQSRGEVVNGHLGPSPASPLLVPGPGYSAQGQNLRHTLRVALPKPVRRLLRLSMAKIALLGQ